MRVQLVNEDAIWPSGFFVEAGSVKLEIDVIPLAMAPDAEIVGHISDLRREDNIITGELSLRDPVVYDSEKDQLVSHCSFLKLKEGTDRTIASCELTGVWLLKGDQPAPPWFNMTFKP